MKDVMDKSGLYISADAKRRMARRKLPFELWGIFALVFSIMLIILAIALFSDQNLGQTGWALLVGGFVLSTALAFCGVMFMRRQSDDSGQNYIEAIFAEHNVPFVITKDEHPFAANKSYLRLFGVKAYNQAVQLEIVPPVDKLIHARSDEDSQALYRLHNLRADASAETAEFYRQSDDGVTIAFTLRVSGLGDTKLWEIIDKPIIDPTSRLFDAAPIGMMNVTDKGEILAMNDALKTWMGAPEPSKAKFDKHPTLNLKDILETDDVFNASPPQEGRKVRGETHLITFAGVHVPVVLNVNWIKSPDGGFTAVTAIHGHSNIQTQTGQAASGNSKAAYAVSERHMSSPLAIIEINEADLNSAKVIRVNKAFEHIFHAPIQTGADVSSLLHISGSEDITRPIDTRLKNKDETPISLYISPDHELNGGAFIYIIDISARRSLESQLSQSQKMQAIGQLAAGVAHDFNNLLQALRLNADDLLGRHPIGDPSYADLQSINSTINRAAALVKKLLAFSRQQTLRPQVLDLGEALSDIMIVLRQVMVERVKLDIIFGRGVPNIMADESQLETVLMNLCVNARDAMMSQGGGEITIETRALNRAEITDPQLQQDLSGLTSDSLAVITVSDTGSGIAPHILEKIFEPFFTTKEQGKGTGLGLATVYGIVQQSGGHLTVESTVGEGTSFHLYFPQVDAEIARAAAEAAAKLPQMNDARAPADLAGQGYILFVEDEDDVRLMAARTLRNRGYHVTEAGDGEEALDILQAGETVFDLMISDVVMPGMDGPTLLKRGKEALGDARIIFISGYAQEDFSDLLAEYPDVSFLPKPFGLKELAERVKEQIGESIV